MSCLDCYYFETNMCKYCNYNSRDYVKPKTIVIVFPPDKDLPF